MVIEKLIKFLEIIIIQIKLFWPYWICGVILGALLVTLSLDKYIKKYISKIGNIYLLIIMGAVGGIISPLSLLGVIPILVPLKKGGVPLAPIISFLVSSPLLNPNIYIFSLVLGPYIASARIVSAIILGVGAGLFILYFEKRGVDIGINFKKVAGKLSTKDHRLSLFKLFFLNIFKMSRFTGKYIIIGFTITALLELYFPKEILLDLFGDQNPFAVVYAASLGVPVYMCGGGVIPLVHSWLWAGMTPGAALAFLITGPGTKVKNLVAFKSIFSTKTLIYYLFYVILGGIIIGYFFNLVIPPWMIN